MASVLKVNEIQHSGGTTALSIDSSGRIIQSTNRPAFWVYKSNGDVAAGNVIAWNGARLNQGSHINLSTGVFTVPITGLYVFHFEGIASGNGECRVRIQVNGSSVSDGRRGNGTASNAYEGLHVQALLALTANDEVSTYVIEGHLYGQNDKHTTWLGYLV